MKNLLILVAVAVIAYFAWDHFKPVPLDGEAIPDEQRYLYLEPSGPVSIADNLQDKRWTIILFTGRSNAESDAVEQRIERAVRERVKTVKLVVMNVDDPGSAASTSLKLERLPTAWLFKGYSQKSSDLEYILQLLGA